MVNDIITIHISKELLHKYLLERVQISSKKRRELSKKGLYLKPFHIVYKKTKHGEMEYRYYGRYWYKILKMNGKVRLIYLGKKDPNNIQIERLGIEGFSFIAYRHKESPVFIRSEVAKKYRELLTNIGISI